MLAVTLAALRAWHRLGRLQLDPALRVLQPGSAASGLVVTATVAVPDTPADRSYGWDVAWADAAREAGQLGADQGTVQALAGGAGKALAGGTRVVVAAHGEVLLARWGRQTPRQPGDPFLRCSCPPNCAGYVLREHARSGPHEPSLCCVAQPLFASPLTWSEPPYGCWVRSKRSRRASRATTSRLPTSVLHRRVLPRARLSRSGRGSYVASPQPAGPSAGLALVRQAREQLRAPGHGSTFARNPGVPAVAASV